MSVNRVSVEVHGPHNLEKALSIFKNKVQRAGILDEYKDNQFYTKPSEARRERLKKAKRLQRENL
jgi:small subunit ribosomal protein S21